MNKKKLIFLVVAWILLLIIILFVMFFGGWSKQSNTSVKTFNIWIVWDSKDDFGRFIGDFKTLYPKYTSTMINVESFSNFEEYYFALMSSIIKWNSPDIFVLNNWEKKPIFNDQILWIDPTVINPNDFRKKYKWVFSDDLIESVDVNWKQQEFLKWIPVWYETLWIFYNWRFIKSADIETLSWLNNTISNLKKSKPDLIPIWIWNWSTVQSVADIIIQFFMLDDWVNSIFEISPAKIKESLAAYLLYWDENWDNNYNSRFADLKALWNDNLSLFSKWETYMVIWYPRMINKIDESWFSTSFLRASPFPHYYTWWWKTLVNYNYFAMNKNTQETTLALDFLSFLTTDTWAQNYLSKFPYYLPALLSLESDKLEEKINKKYNVVLKDFYNNDFELSSFDRWIKSIFDNWVVPILDNSSNYEKEFTNFIANIVCKSHKFSDLKNLSSKCE